MALQIPGVPQLEALHADADKVIDAVTTVLDFAEKYGAFVPGLAGALPVVRELDSVLKNVKAFLDKVPG